MLNLSIRKFPAVFTLLPFIAGLVLAYFVKFRLFSESSVYTILLLTLILLSTILYLKLQPEFRDPRLFIFYTIIVFLAGIVRYEQKLNDSSTVELESILGDEKETEVSLFGTVIEQPELSNDYARMLIASDSIISQNNVHRINIKILCRIYRNKYSEQLDKIVLFGDDVSIEGKLQQLPHKRNPGEFDYGNYLKIHGINAIFATYGFDKIIIKGNSPLDFYIEKIIYPVKTYCSQVIDRFIPGNESEFLKGIVLGERSGITKEAKESFINAGVAHIIAVSGLNVAYVLICVGVLLTFVPVKYKYKIFILILFLIFYMNLTGNAPSIVRAVIMASVFLLSRLLERKPNPYSIISFSALIILAIDPQQLFDSGFILSFSAVLSIVYFYPKLEKLISKLKFYKGLEEGNLLHKAIRLIITYLLVTSAAQIGILPITAIMFEKISVVSLFTNLIVIPLSNVALAIGFLVILTSLVSSWLAGIFASAASVILYFLLWFIHYSAGFDFSFIETYSFDLILFVFYYLLVFTLFSVNKLNYKAKAVIILLLITDLYLIDSQFYKVEDIRVAYLDVGNSNSSLISVADGRNFLVNAGSSGINYNSSERNVIPYLKRQRISKIDIMFLTGLDFNEFRNLVYFAISFPVAKIILPSYYKSLFEDRFVRRVFNRTEVEFVEQEALAKFNDTCIFYIDCDGKVMAVSLLYGETSFVFTGFDNELWERDAGFYAENDPRVLRLLGGSSFDHYPASFILKVNPKLIITSSSSKRRIQSEIFETALNKSGFKTINVSDDGAVIIESDGKVVQQVSWK
jgi:competence protein ComEC